MTISQTETTTLERFQKAVGVGRIHGPYKRGPHKPRWQWHTEGSANCALVLTRLWRYLGQPKRQQAEDVLARHKAYVEGLTYQTLDGKYPWTYRKEHSLGESA